MDGRVGFISERVSESLGIDKDTVDRFLSREKSSVLDFFTSVGPQTLLVSYQVPEEQTPEGEWVKRGNNPVLQLVTRLSHRLRGNACYFFHSSQKGVAEKAAAEEVQNGVIRGDALTALRSLVNDMFGPVLRKQEKWGRLTADLQAELLKRVSAFGATLTEAAESLVNSVELTKPDAKYMSCPMNLSTFKDLADKPESAKDMQHCLHSWIVKVERLLQENDCGSGSGEDGPMTELLFWRQRMAKFNSVTQQLKCKECRIVLGVCNAAKSSEYKIWKELDLKLTDAANESKDNVKFLSTLEKTLEPMYEGTPQDIIDGLPALMDNIRMMHTIARYYSTAERMTTLFMKITNQMITTCKEHINPEVRKPEKLWKLSKPELVARMQVAINLADSYEKAFEHTRRQLMTQPKGKQFDFNKDKIFEKFNIFKRRLEKLVDMFKTIHQFSSLEQHTHIEGLSDMIANFNTITDNVRMKGLDLLDFFNTQFDRDYLEFNVNIHDLEMNLQTFINRSFENISSTEQALNLLKQIQQIMQRDSLKADLEAKYMIIFQHYGLDMDSVQKLYETHKYNPPVPRNAPPVAGNIMWARQLLRRIETPMRQFERVKSIMGTKDSRRIIKTYNRVAKTLMEFEALWHQAWLMSVDSVRQGLGATLLVRHPQTAQLVVNFDKDIAKLVREARCMKHMGINIPSIAQTVLLEERKFNYYFQRLCHIVREHSRVMNSMRSILKPLLKPHIDDLEKKLAPGLTVLSWMSLNIDGFIHLLTHAISRFEELVSKINDMLSNRVEKNLDLISRMLLINLPADQSFSYEEFVTMQSKFIAKQGAAMSVRNQEVWRTVQELVQLIRTAPRENPSVSMDKDAIANFNDHFYLRMYGAIVQASRNSFSVLKERLRPTSSEQQSSFFDVEVNLKVPCVVVSPSLDEIQEAVNTCAKKVLSVTKELTPWAIDKSIGSFWDMLSHDMDIVKSVLLLKGTVDGAKTTVRQYIDHFNEFSFLWLESLNDQYERFVAKEPSMEDFEHKLKEYAAVELRLHAISPAESIGPLCVSTAPIKTHLLGEAASWKQQFAQKLHNEGADKLHSFDLYVRETTRKLNGKIEDLEDVRNMMDVLQEVRDKEANIDNLINPIEDMYALLMKYQVAVPKEESDLVSDLHYSWKKLRKLATELSNKLAKLQAGFKRELIKQVNVFVVEARSFKESWDAEGPMVPNLDAMDAADRLRKFKQTFEVNKSKWDNYASGEELFGLAVTKYPELEDIQDKIANLDKLYSLYVNVIQTIQGYGDVLWTDVVANIDEMSNAVNGFQARAKTLPKALRDWPAYKDCRTTIDNFLELLPLVQALTDPAVSDRHWVELISITGHEIPYQHEDVFKLQHLLDANLLKKCEDVEDLAAAAVKEKQIERKLDVLRGEWAVQDVKFMEHKNRGPVVIKPADYAELVEKLEESQMNLSSMATNRYSKPFEADVSEWLKKLGTVSEIMEQWFQVQNVWTYMEAVFSGGDIVKQLPTEAKRFQNIDKNFMKIVAMAAETANVVDVCNGIELVKTMLPHLQEQLELCQKSLSAYLETKRGEFPRFYFVSDPTLLEILSLGSHPPSVVPHFMSGLFDSMADVRFDEADASKITHMSSPQREEVELDYPVDTKGNIEVWLQRLVDGMKDTVCAVIKAANRNVYNQELETFIFGHPAQIALLGIQFMWTADTQSALTNAKTDKGIMSKNMKKTDAILREMVMITVKTSLTGIQRTNLETCITVHMHQKESTEDLVKKKIKDPTDFEWLKQARFYWREDRNTVIISICDVDFQYSFEYLGVKERLVITPLTDICYITLSQALGMFLGGAPAGPAGTGKTETTKDLGNTLGKFVVVFNCSDQMDYIGMGKIYKGLAQSGLWGCFDEFNRINLDVLSVCAQQVYCVLSAIRERKKQFTFTDGSVVDLDDRVGFFITMNPGYAGRQELPENLKALFRGVTMMVPNRQIIMKVKLAACGYQENDILSKKFFVLYGLCEQQLSKQAHYDFGLRNILSVLRTGGASKRASPEKSEIFLMMRTLRDMNMSKFVAEDVPLFMSLIKDLFPGLEAERASFPEVEKALNEQILEKGLQVHPTWVNKCIQLYETYLVRHGIMLVGPSGGGKSTIEECVAGALSVVIGKHQIWRMNPKAITAPQMFGRLDPATGDWTDGVFAELWRRAAKTKDKHTWIVLDGPVDAIWIENLNTVLDDNKVLTLANGDRIIMSPLMKAMFEPENLANASPATVSRAGIIYVSDVELGWLPPVISWLDRKPAYLKEILQPLFEKYVDTLLTNLRLSYRPLMYNETACTLAAMRTLMDGCLGETEGAPQLDTMKVKRYFVYCLTWSLGGLLSEKDRPALDADIRAIGGDELPPKEDDDSTVFEYTVNSEGNWQHWSGLVPHWAYPKQTEKPKFAQLNIPTLDSTRFDALLSLVASVHKSSLLVGGPGTAKTTVINMFTAKFPVEEVASKVITFSSLTTPGIFQKTIEAAVEKRQGRTFGPPGGKKMMVFIDDISMPFINDWGDQVTNEIVRQLLEQNGFYSTEKPIGDMKFIVDCNYIGAMNTPGGGKNDIPNRLKRQFNLYYVPLPSKASINNVYGALVEGRFTPDLFDADTIDLSKRLVPMTIALWNKVQGKMLPTPAKFHYLFNMRELSKIFQGIILATRDRFTKTAPSDSYGGNVTSSAGYLLALWLHECRRVFCDKLTSHDDKEWVDSAIFKLMNDSCPADVVNQVEEPVYFVDFLREPVEDPETGEVIDAHPSYYEAVPKGLPEVRTRVEALQAKFNEESRVYKLELVLFTDALLHLMRIARLVCMDRGSALLVGVGGSGKQSLSRLAAYIRGAYTFQITITKTYNVTNLFEDIKGLYKIAAVKGQPVVFIFTDAEVKDEGFLEYINQILMTGEVAGLMPKDELDAMVNDMRPIMKAAIQRGDIPAQPDTYENLYSFYLNRVRDNLHLVLCFSPVGAKFSRRAMQFPGLINGCTIDWFLPWPEEALTSVSGKFIQSFDMACEPVVKDSLKLVMGHVHVFVTAACHEYFEKFRRHAYVTPKSFLSFIQFYMNLYKVKWESVAQLATAINAGLEKMDEAKVDVGRMKQNLAIKNQELAKASKEAEALLKSISESTAIAEKEKNKVAVIVDSVSTKAAEIAAVKAGCEKDLAAAQPALDAAVSALNSITPKDIGALKALKNPPDIVKRIFDCVLVLRMFPLDKPQWQEVKGYNVICGAYEASVKMMSDSQFLSTLMNFPKEQINDETVELLQPYFAAPDFNFESAQKASGNVAGLCNWAEAMCSYHNVAVVVEPKIQALREAESELKVANKEKAAAEERMAIVQAKLDEAQAEFDRAMAQKQALEEDAAATQKKMDSANALISALAGEETRWTEQSKEFDATIQRLTGDCCIASAFVSYLGPFNKEFRDLLIKRDFFADCRDQDVPTTPNMNLTSFLVDDATIGEWNLQGLPTDDLSIQNGIMVNNAARYPVLVDPQGQARTWILNKESKNDLRVTQLNDKMFRMALEDCLSTGKPLLIENIEEDLDPVLDPVLEKRVIKKGRNYIMPLADKEVDFDPNFKIFITTRLPNPHYTPELSAKVTLIDFTVTMVGLEDQLLGRLIGKEKGELEEQRQNLIEEVQSYKKKIKQLEDDLLDRLSNSTGNLLDDTELIDVLATTKQTAQDVAEKLANASETNTKITEACEEFRPVAHRATLIYFLIAEFSVVNCMYQTSLAQFTQLYELAIDRSEPATLPSKRIQNIIDYLTYEIYLYIQRGLFERHKLLFALMLTNKVLLSSGATRASDIDVFLKGGGALDIMSVRKKPKDWIPDNVWLNVIALSQMDSFRDIPDSVFRNDSLWKQWYDQEAPEMAKVPEYEDRLSKFERMCVVKTFREDRTLVAAAEYVADTLGQRYVESVPLNMDRAWTESNKTCPLICLLSRGSDPTKLIEDLAKKKKIKVLGVSMGQGQEIIARKYMATASQEGQWVLLQNTHLGLGYLTEVETFLVKEADSIHEDFRLWITAEPHPAFPIGLLQMGIKITNEAPVGMKAGLRASYQWVTQDMLDAVSRFEWRQLLFIQCYIHSVVQERRKFGPIGWNIPYEFNQSDLSACTQFLQNHTLEMESKKAPEPNWSTVRYMVSQIQYGGKITDDFDMLLMDTYAEKYFHAGAMKVQAEIYRDERSGFPYCIPEGQDIDVYRAYIDTLPAQESPEIFGLHPNADLTFRTLQVQDAILTILDTMPKGGGGGGSLSREDVVDKICEELLSKCPPAFDKEDVKDKAAKLPGGSTMPLTVTLRQEIDCLNIVIKLTKSTLSNLRLAIAGSVALSGDLIDALDALFNARIPASWLGKSWQASTLGNWFTGLLQRFDQLSKWINTGRPRSFWLTGFFNPQGFLTAMKQEVNRRHTADKWALDDVVMTAAVTHPARDFEGLKDTPSEGVYVHGLFLDGAAWSKSANRLTDAEPKELYNPLPVIHVTGVQARDKPKKDIFECPTYRVKRRTGQYFITTLSLRTEDPKSKFVMHELLRRYSPNHVYSNALTYYKEKVASHPANRLELARSVFATTTHRLPERFLFLPQILLYSPAITIVGLGIESLCEQYSMSWKNLLEKALKRNRSAQNSRYFQLATVRSDGRPACRTVVFRGFLNDSEHVTICTDSRSEKIAQFAEQPCSHVCWYFPISREQFRIDCKAEVVDFDSKSADLAKAREEMWARLSPNARAQFTWPHPGLPRVDDESVYDVSGPPDGEPAADTFCMVVLRVSEVEYISLKSNERLRFLPEEGGWSEERLNT